jgi:hypothetical protein
MTGPRPQSRSGWPSNALRRALGPNWATAGHKASALATSQATNASARNLSAAIATWTRAMRVARLRLPSGSVKERRDHGLVPETEADRARPQADLA